MRIFTKIEIDGSRRLAEKLRARKRIVFGTWFYDTKDPEHEPFLWCNLTDELKPEHYIPLWQEYDCLDWLRGRGYYYAIYYQVGGGVVVDVFKLVDGQRSLYHQIHGKTILDGLIGSVLAIVEEGKK